MEIREIQKLVKHDKILWTIHVKKRLTVRRLNELDVLECLKNGEIIEDYPDDFPYPSCLIYGKTIKNKAIHVVVSIGEGLVIIVTAYEPDTIKFESDLKTRRGKQ